MRSIAICAALCSTILLIGGCGNDAKNSAKTGAAKKVTPKSVKEADLKAAVGDPQNNASFVSNMVAQCVAKAATATECNDPKKVATFNPTYAKTLELGDKPGGTTVQVDAADSFSATAHSVEVPGVGVTEWTYFKKPGSSDYQNRCAPDIEKYCVKGKITPYYG